VIGARREQDLDGLGVSLCHRPHQGGRTAAALARIDVAARFD
jgi:hypothetical protein